MLRKMLVMFLILLSLGCTGKMQVKGVKIVTLMSGKVEYYALTDCGEKEVSKGVYDNLVYKLNHLAAGKILMCDMEKGLGGIYDLAVCFQDVIAVSEAGEE